MEEASPRQAAVDPALAAMGRSLNEAIRVLGDRSGDETDGVNRRYIPGPLQSSGQTVSGILELVQTLIHGDDAEEGEEGDSAPAGLVSGGGDGAHVALLGHSLAAYMSVLPRERLRRLTTRILSDTMLWFCRLFRFENGSAYYHGDEHDGLLRVCRLALHSRYDDYATDGFQALTRQPPVVYVSAAASPGTAQHLCRQLGLPLSCLCTVPCNTVFGSQHQMDVASLERLVKDDISSGKLPLLLVANAGTPVAGHTDKLGRLRELCDQHGLWLHAQGVNLATLVLGYVSSSVLAAVKCDSLTLTPGPWLGLPACPAVTLYRHDDPALSLAAGLASCQPVEKLRALPLWLSLQRLGHDGVVQRVRHASALSQRLIEKLKLVPGVRTLVEDELSSPVVLFKYAGDSWQPASERDPAEDVNQDVMDAFNRWLGEELARAAPACAVDAVELGDVGVCLRFSPLSCAAGKHSNNHRHYRTLNNDNNHSHAATIATPQPRAHGNNHSVTTTVTQQQP